MPKKDNEGGNDDDISALSADGMVVSTAAILNFIDLAGSERANIHDTPSKSSVPIGATIRNASPYGSTHPRSNSNNKGGMGAS